MKTLDCRGLACPQPVMRTRDALEQGRPQELLVLVDNAAGKAVGWLTRCRWQGRMAANGGILRRKEASCSLSVCEVAG